MNDRDQFLIRCLVGRALGNLVNVPMHRRADLFEAAALLLNGDEAAEAAAIAHSIRASEARQTEFFALVTSD